MIFTGQAGGWPAGFASKIGETRGVEFVPIKFEVADDLAFWRAEIPGRVVGCAEALSGPTTPPRKRVQTINPPGSEVGPGQIATWGRSTELRNEGFGFKWTGNNWSSKHISVRLDGRGSRVGSSIVWSIKTRLPCRLGACRCVLDIGSDILRDDLK